MNSAFFISHPLKCVIVGSLYNYFSQNTIIFYKKCKEINHIVDVLCTGTKIACKKLIKFSGAEHAYY